MTDLEREALKAAIARDKAIVKLIKIILEER